MKLCKDCLHYRHVFDVLHGTKSLCMHDPKLDLVYGKVVDKYCHAERLETFTNAVNRCGPEGQFWIEAKPF